MFCNVCLTNKYSFNDRECVVCVKCGTVLSEVLFVNEINPANPCETKTETENSHSQCCEMTYEVMEKLHIPSCYHSLARQIIKKKSVVFNFSAEEWALVTCYVILERINSTSQYPLSEMGKRFDVNCSRLWKLYEKMDSNVAVTEEEGKVQKEEGFQPEIRTTLAKPNFFPLIAKFLHNLNIPQCGAELNKVEKEVNFLCHVLYQNLFSQPQTTIVATAIYLLGKKKKVPNWQKMTLQSINQATLVSQSTIKRSITKLRFLKNVKKGRE